jgi:hypothetical protein
VAQVGVSTATTHAAPGRKGLADLAPTMHQSHQTYDCRAGVNFAGFCVYSSNVSNDCKTRRFAARVQLNTQWLQRAGCNHAIGESNHKGHQAVHARPSTGQQQPGSLLGARHHWYAFKIQHKN